MQRLLAGWHGFGDKLSQKSFYPWLVWALGATFFFAQYFGRLAPSVMAPQLMQSFNVDALGLGALSASFYYAYVGMQVPVGALVDRFGAHRLLMMTTAICGLGCVMFAHASSLWMGQLSRLLMGFGAAFAFVGTLKLATVWFPASRLGYLAGLTQALGMLGAAMGEGPVAFSVESWGWRSTMLLFAVILGGLAILIGVLVKDHPDGHKDSETRVESARDIWQGLVIVLKNPQTWYNSMYAGLVFAPTAAFAELWGVTYFVNVHGLTQTAAANGISFIFLGWAVGGPIAGWLSDKIKLRKPVMLGFAVACMLALCAALYIDGLPVCGLYALLFAYGVFNTGLVASYAVSGEINPKPVAGISIAFTNMMSVMIGTIFQPIIGWFLVMQWQGDVANGVHTYSAHAYHLAMLAMPACLMASVVALYWVKETHCQGYDQLTATQ